jgi:hypothetical protein
VPFDAFGALAHVLTSAPSTTAANETGSEACAAGRAERACMMHEVTGGSVPGETKTRRAPKSTPRLDSFVFEDRLRPRDDARDVRIFSGVTGGEVGLRATASFLLEELLLLTVLPCALFLAFDERVVRHLRRADHQPR